MDGLGFWRNGLDEFYRKSSIDPGYLRHRGELSCDVVSLRRQVADPLQFHQGDLQTAGDRFLGVVVRTCRFIEPAIHAMAAKFTDVNFAKIDVDELSEVSQGFGVQAMPTFVLLKNGKEVDRVVGAKKDELEQKVEKYRG